jgi:hypothetical protein
MTPRQPEQMEIQGREIKSRVQIYLYVGIPGDKS